MNRIGNKLIMARMSTIVIVFLLVITIGCDKTERYNAEHNVLLELYSQKHTPSPKLEKEVDLYVDYSTCVAQAVNTTGSFFNQIKARITGQYPTLYAIKGSNIEMISSDFDMVNSELNRVEEVFAADIRQAVEDISKGDRQAILITDGEYWTPVEKERNNLPYMKQSFINWINKGFSIYILTEDYRERYNNGEYEKKRFYFLFTDDKISDNIYDVIRRGFEIEDFPRVKIFKLTNSDLKLIRKTTVNFDLDFKIDTTQKYDYIEIYNPWNQIFEFVIYAKDENGNIIPGGNPVIENIVLNSKELENFTINDIKIKAYNISKVYLDSALNQNFALEIKEGIELDKESFTRDGSLTIKFTEKINSYLFGKNDSENLIQIDFIIEKATHKPANRNWFVWNAMLVPNNPPNLSIYESIKQILDEQEINPKNQNNGVIHTIYLKTLEYK